MANFEQSAEEARRTLAQMKQWESRLTDAAKQQAQTPVSKMPELGTLKRKIANLSTYDQHNVNDQRQRLYLLLGIENSKRN
jgi:hypothetical protein